MSAEPSPSHVQQHRTVVQALVAAVASPAPRITVIREDAGERGTYLVGTDRILKVGAPPTSAILAREAAILQHLQAYPAISVPRVLEAGHHGAIAYVWLQRLPGRPVHQLRLRGTARRHILRALGRTLARIHAVPQLALDAEVDIPRDRHTADLQIRLATAFAQVLARLGHLELPWTLPLSPIEIVAHAVQQLPVARAFAMLHARAGPSQTLASRGCYTGTIGFREAVVSHPALDLLHWPDPRDREALLDGYRAERHVDASFLRVWHVGQVLTDLDVIATSPDLRGAAQQHLRTLITTDR